MDGYMQHVPCFAPLSLLHRRAITQPRFPDRFSIRPRSISNLLGPALALSLLAGPVDAAVPDLTQSFFVPQAGSLATPCEGGTGNCTAVAAADLSYPLSVGGGAIGTFRACPNNDGTQVLRNNARVKVVLKASDGSPIAGVSPADICVLLNGGTPAQGFSGIGADSIIANSTWNVDPRCPDVTCIPADAPTDANGVTFITLRGSVPGSPGVSIRDPNRKWGHFDSDMPVVVLGYKLQGRLTTGGAQGSYTLGIKNFDMVGGLEASLDEGEVVSGTDLTALFRDMPTYNFARDFDNNGIISAIDLNFILAHMNHDCDTPLNP
jgi:hypothetical protein